MMGLLPARGACGLDSVDRAVRAVQDGWRDGAPSLERIRSAHPGSISVLAALVKADMACRFDRGQRPAVADYLDRFPELRRDDDRVLSLIYEEFCLLEERGERPDAEGFCDRYATWRRSLESQLRYHRLLSEVVGPPPAPPRLPEPGEYFEEFRLDRLLGQGSAGRVFLARDESLSHRRVALKVSPDRGPEPEILGRLDHPNIIPVHSVVFQPETQLRGLCMPYRPGLPLDLVIRRVAGSKAPRGAEALWKAVASGSGTSADEGAAEAGAGWVGFPHRGTYPEAVAWVVAALADALAYAHARGVLHRDVKPANVLLSVRDGPQLLDFNLAHDPHAPEQAEAALRGGTLPYMAPEQLEAFLDPQRWDRVGAAADLYSLGLVMHELLTGQAPEAPESARSMPRAIRALLDRRAALAESPRRLNPTIPHAVEAITARCLAFDPAGRYPGASALAEDLRGFLAREPLRHAVNPSTGERAGNWARRNRRRLAIASVLLAALVATSYPAAVKALVPFDRRAAFQAAMQAIDESRYREAIRWLEALVDDYPRSPIPRLYLSSALNHSGDLGAADTQFSELLEIAGARKTVRDWGTHHRDVATHLEWLGQSFLDRRMNSLAERAFTDAVEIDPTLRAACLGLAQIRERNNNFPAAHDLLSGLIGLAESRRSRDDRKILADLYLRRAVNSTHWAEDLLRPGSMSASSAIDHLDAALKDLVDSAEVFQPNTREHAFRVGLARADALLFLGAAASLAGDDAASTRHFGAAREVLENVLKPEGSDQVVQRNQMLQKLGLRRMEVAQQLRQRGAR